MKKLEGFTIIELTIALAVSAVTVGIAMYTLNYVSIVSKKRSLSK
jgi:prepilin-type N-terminal cleavage/methylation domain-containing protein